MKSNDIYEAKKQEAFLKIRHQRDPHVPQEIGLDDISGNPLNEILFSIKDKDAESYDWIIKQSELYSIDMFKNIIIALLDRYNIPVHVINCDENRISPKPVLAFVTEKEKTLYVLQGVDKSERLPREALASLFVAYQANSMKIIMMVHEYAYKLIYNHNDNEKDPSRGTGLFSLKDMFDDLFGKEEFDCFKAFEREYVRDIRRYLGYQIVRTLTPNALFSFKKVVDYSLLSFPYGEHIAQLTKYTIPVDTYEIIRQQFLDKRHYKALIGKTAFAQSFVTAEWLYDTMKTAGRIDYTAVAMGYFKAVEQLMFELIKLHAGERGRTLKRQGSNEYDVLTQANLDAKCLDTSLGSLIGFLKYYRNWDQKPLCLRRRLLCT